MSVQLFNFKAYENQYELQNEFFVTHTSTKFCPQNLNKNGYLFTKKYKVKDAESVNPEGTLAGAIFGNCIFISTAVSHLLLKF